MNDWLCPNKTSLMDTDFEFHVNFSSHKILFSFQFFFNHLKSKNHPQPVGYTKTGGGPNLTHKP